MAEEETKPEEVQPPHLVKPKETDEGEVKPVVPKPKTTSEPEHQDGGNPQSG